MWEISYESSSKMSMNELQLSRIPPHVDWQTRTKLPFAPNERPSQQDIEFGDLNSFCWCKNKTGQDNS